MNPERQDVTLRLGANTADQLIEVNGLNITRAVHAVTLESEAGGHVTRVTLDLLILDASTYADSAAVIVPPDTADALIAIGWTPPGQRAT